VHIARKWATGRATVRKTNKKKKQKKKKKKQEVKVLSLGEDED
jgi:hypothetical protein